MTHAVGNTAPSSQRLKQLGQYASSPGHRGLAVTQNSPFSSLAVALYIAIASTHCAYPRRDGQAELIWRCASTQNNEVWSNRSEVSSDVNKDFIHKDQDVPAHKTMKFGQIAQKLAVMLTRTLFTRIHWKFEPKEQNKTDRHTSKHTRPNALPSATSRPPEICWF